MRNRIVRQNARNPKLSRRRINPQLRDTSLLAPNRSGARLQIPPSGQLRTASFGGMNPRSPRLGLVCPFPNTVAASSIHTVDVVTPKLNVSLAVPDFADTRGVKISKGNFIVNFAN